MANLVFDFLHSYETGERRESEPANAYQYDEGHVLEAVLPSAVTSCEIHYWIRGQEKSEAYTPGSITQNDDGSCTVIGNIPNLYFETNGELRVYIVVTDGDASITTYEGFVHICQRSMPDDYVDDDPENEATRVLTEAQEAAAAATAAAQTAQDVADSIPEDYSQLSEDVDTLKDGLNDISEKNDELTFSDFEQGYYKSTTGEKTNSSKFIRTQPKAIWVKQNEGINKYIGVACDTSGVYTYAIFFDKNRTFINSAAVGNTTNGRALLPPTAAYVAVQAKYNNGNDLPASTDITITVHIMAGNRTQIITATEIENQSLVPFEHRKEITLSLFKGYSYGLSSGELVASNSRQYTKVFPVQSGKYYKAVNNASLNPPRLNCYDKDLNYLGYIYMWNGDTPSGYLMTPTPDNTAFGVLTIGDIVSTDITIKEVDGQNLISAAYPYDGDEYIYIPGVYYDGNGFAENADLMTIIVPNVSGKYVSANENAADTAYFYMKDGTVIDGSNTYIQQGLSVRTYPIPNGVYGVIMVLHQNFVDTVRDGMKTASIQIVKDVLTDDQYNGENALIGKKIACIGDSITYLDGRANQAESGSTRLQGYQHYLRRAGAYVTNYGFNGYPYATVDTNCIYNEIVTNQVDLSDYDIILLFGGANDVRLSTPLGNHNTSYATPNVDPSNFIGAIGAIVQYIRTTNPTAEIFICTMLPSDAASRTYEHNRQYVDAVRELSNFWSLPVIDMFRLMNATPGINYTNVYSYDGTHPNGRGYERIGKVITASLASYKFFY